MTEVAAPRSVRAYDAVWALPLAAWVGVALIAAFRPHLLPQPVASPIPFRWDTVGVVSFAVAVAAFFAVSLLLRRGRPALRAIRIFGSATAVYLSLNAITHPETLWLPLTHFLPWPSELITLLTSAAGAIIAHLSLQGTR